MKFRAKRRIIVKLSDLHGGHRVGLLAPDTLLFELDDKGNAHDWIPDLGPVQEEILWPAFLEHKAEVKKLAGRDSIILLVGGDTMHGGRFTTGLLVEDRHNQVRIATTCLLRWCDGLNIDKIRMAQGTPVHTYAGTAEAMVARNLREDGLDAEGYYHAKYDVDGVMMDIAHKGPTKGIREWTHGNAGRYYLRDRMWKEIQRDKRPPHLYLRFHFHVLVRERVWGMWRGDKLYSDLVLVPSYCGMTAYGVAATQAEPYLLNGLVATEIVDGEIESIIPFTTETDLRTTEVL